MPCIVNQGNLKFPNSIGNVTACMWRKSQISEQYSKCNGILIKEISYAMCH